MSPCQLKSRKCSGQTLWPLPCNRIPRLQSAPAQPVCSGYSEVKCNSEEGSNALGLMGYAGGWRSSGNVADVQLRRRTSSSHGPPAVFRLHVNGGVYGNPACLQLVKVATL